MSMPFGKGKKNLPGKRRRLLGTKPKKKVSGGRRPTFVD